MATRKKTGKSKVIEDNMNSTKEIKTEKRQRKDPFEMEDDDNFEFKPIGNYHANNKKKIKVESDTKANVTMFKSTDQFQPSLMKNEPDTEADNIMSGLIGQHQASIKNEPGSGTAEVRKTVLDLFDEQQKTRKQYKENLFKNISKITSQMEANCDVMKENNQKLEQLTVSFMKCIQQAADAFKKNTTALNGMHSFEKQVEGLLARGAMKPDDRPIWFDVYRAFPPLLEPKFARPKPEIKPIRQIFYKEDVIRAEFHSKGHGVGAVNMLAQSNDTQTKRLVQQYEKLKAEGVPEEELIEKSATAVGMERREQYEAASATKPANITPENPNSVSAQVLAEADLKNIFKE